jgi:hypothetical protein
MPPTRENLLTGAGGWADRQLPDGAVAWTAPSGCTYTTTPTGSIFFPVLATRTGELVIPGETHALNIGQEAMMPRRKRTHAAERHYRITCERRINEERLAQEHRKRMAELARNEEPPPF